MNKISVTINDGLLQVKTPFSHAGFTKDAKDAQGRWSPIKNAWIFDVRNEAIVRKDLIKHYGGDGTTRADVLSIVLDIQRRSAWQGPVVIIGRVIARAFGRDSGSKLGPGIVFLSGEHTSGGSRINWTTVVEGEFLLHDVPRATAMRLIEGKSRLQGVTARLYDTSPKPANDVVLDLSINQSAAQGVEMASSVRKIDRARRMAKVAIIPTSFDSIIQMVGVDLLKSLTSAQIAALADRIYTACNKIEGVPGRDAISYETALNILNQ